MHLLLRVYSKRTLHYDEKMNIAKKCIDDPPVGSCNSQLLMVQWTPVVEGLWAHEEGLAAQDLVHWKLSVLEEEE